MSHICQYIVLVQIKFKLVLLYVVSSVHKKHLSFGASDIQDILAQTSKSESNHGCKLKSFPDFLYLMSMAKQ